VNWTTVEHIAAHEGGDVGLRGWVHNLRSSGRIMFLILRDGTGFIQAVISRADVGDEAFGRCRALTQESAVKVRGVVRRDDRAPGGYELQVRGVEVVNVAHAYPLVPKEHGVEFLLDHRHLWLRTPRQHALMRIRAELIFACHEFLRQRGFIHIDAPLLTPAACEGTTTLFETDYFGDKAYLSQSGQLYNEAAAMAFGRVYCYGPTFRAERSKTRRHLLEFWMLEPEAAFMDLDECMELEEDMVAHIVARILETRRQELETLGRDIAPLERVRPPFPRISYDEALEVAARAGEASKWGEDFGAPVETAIAAAFDRPAFVHRYPTQCKAFYMEPDPKRPEVVLGADLLAPEGYGEIIGGGQRISDLGLLRRRIDEHGLPEEAYEWYVDLRRFGSVPHSGFGLGIERTVAWIAGIDHLREAIPFPRLLNRLYP